MLFYRQTAITMITRSMIALYDSAVIDAMSLDRKYATAANFLGLVPNFLRVGHFEILKKFLDREDLQRREVLSLHSTKRRRLYRGSL